MNPVLDFRKETHFFFVLSGGLTVIRAPWESLFLLAKDLELISCLASDKFLIHFTLWRIFMVNSLS